MFSEPPTWLEYKEMLKAHRQQLLTSVNDKSITGEQFLKNQKEFTEEVKKFVAGIIRDCETLLGAAPCKFAFCCLGSMSAEDMNIFSDLEILLLLETPDASAWEQVVYSATSWNVRHNAAEYFKTLYNMFQCHVYSIGETATLGPVTDPIKHSGFHLDSTGHPGVELRLRGTAQVRKDQIFNQCQLLMNLF